MGGVSDLNLNKWNQSTLFSRMIDFWKTDILTKWHIPYVTMVGRRQFNIPISSEVVISLPGHSLSLKIMIPSNFFLLWAKRGTAVVSGSCAHVCTLSLLDFCISFRKKETAILLKTKVEMPNSVSTNRNQVWPDDQIGGNQRNKTNRID